MPTCPLLPSCVLLALLLLGSAGAAGNAAPASPAPQAQLSAEQRFEQDLKSALQRGDRAEFTRLARQTGDSVPAGPHGKTALMYAAEAGDLDAVSRLVALKDGSWTFPCLANPADARAGKEYLDRCDVLSDVTYGYTALMYAADKGHAPVVNYLLNAGADPGKKCRFAQFTALQLAQNGGHEAAAAALQGYQPRRSLLEAAWTALDSQATALVGGMLGATIIFLIRFYVILRRRRGKRHEAAGAA